MTGYELHPGSFRDPSGYVFTHDDRVFRALGARGSEEFDAARSSGLLDIACERGLLIASASVSSNMQTEQFRGARGEVLEQVIEHPRIPLITYPYEWTFEQLRDAALQHLELHLLALAHDFDLSDATAYNMQFNVGLPLHIDVLSLRRYRDGRPWEGYNQFCRQFLAPLLLESIAGVQFQRWYRGSLNGLELDELKKLIPARRRFTSLNFLMHVQLQTNAIKGASSNNLTDRTVRLPVISKRRYIAMLEGLRDWIASLRPGRTRKTYWADYSRINSYAEQEKREKLAFVETMAHHWRLRSVLDVGGNSGDYSQAAIAGGVTHAWCLDGDVDALAVAYRRRKSDSPGLLPVVMNWVDPSPGQGWDTRERSTFKERLHADAVMALAVIHHVVIGNNVPLSEFVRQLFTCSDKVIVEFVPKEDPMVQGLLRTREDIFGDYTEENFIRLLELHSQVARVCRLKAGGRTLFACLRK